MTLLSCALLLVIVVAVVEARRRAGRRAATAASIQARRERNVPVQMVSSNLKGLGEAPE
jgi:hypothetical protein